MDEHMYLTDACTGKFCGGFADHNLCDLTFLWQRITDTLDHMKVKSFHGETRLRSFTFTAGTPA